MIFSSKIHCQTCIDKIIFSLTALKGIKTVRVDIDNQTITVEPSDEGHADRIIQTLKKINIIAVRIN